MLMLSACATGIPVTNKNAVCAGWAPVTVSKKDVLTTQTLREINNHNLFGEKNGCWKPLRK